MAAKFQQKLDAENIAAASITHHTEDHLPGLQSIGSTVFCRWMKLIKPK
jgi:ribonuclease BN (tRNA processing enzyme)